jgi:hypothetical protein
LSVVGSFTRDLKLKNEISYYAASNKRMTKSTNKLLKRIRECETQIDNLKALPYYSIFKQEGQRQKDIAAVEKKLEKLHRKYSVYSRSRQYSA